MLKDLKDMQKKLEDSGIESAQIDAESIFCHILGCDRIDLYAQEFTIKSDKKRLLESLIKRRSKREPLQHITGRAYFYGREFKTAKNVFIPRPETEILVENVIKALSSRSDSAERLDILELCAGSGVAAITLTKELPFCKIFASDISSEAISLALDNAHFHNTQERIDFRIGDLFEPWKNEALMFDALVCNPPYIKRSMESVLSPEVRHDPFDALYGGSDGLGFYRRIIKDAHLYLKRKGYIFFECSPDVSCGAEDIFALNKNFSNIEKVKDYNLKDRVILAQRI